MNKMNIMIGILAGGKATRMNNQDKGLVMYNGKYMIENIFVISEIVFVKLFITFLKGCLIV